MKAVGARLPKRAAWLALALALTLAPSAATLAAPRALSVDRAPDRIAIVVGNNVGRDPRRSLRYAEGEVGRLAGVLERTGNFQNVQVLRAQSRPEVEAALVNASRRLEASRRAGRPTLFLFYYSGHADGEALELGPSRLPLRDLRTYLEGMPADVRLGFIDACQSGALTGVKGGRRAPAYEVRIADTGSVKGLAIVTSSTANEFSQESDDLRSSYFSHNLMTGLQGLADSSGDGRVTLSELYQFAYRRTLAGTAASPIGEQHPTYDYRISGTGDVVLTETRPRDARLQFPPEPGATYTVLDRNEVLAEVVPSPREPVYLALPQGQYRVLRRSLAHVSERLLSLSVGSVTIESRDFTPIANEPARLARKGGGQGAEKDRGTEGDLTEHALTPVAGVPRNRLALELGLQTRPVAGGEPVTAWGLTYQRELSPAFALRGRGEIARFFSEANPSGRADFVRVAPAIDLLVRLAGGERLSLAAGPMVGAPLVHQSEGTVSRWSYGVQYGATGTLAWAVNDGPMPLVVTLSLSGGGELFKLDGRRVQVGFVSGSVGAGFAF